MSEPTEKPEPVMIERTAVHAQIRDALLQHPKLTFDIDPRQVRLVATGEYSSHVMARANMLTAKVLDHIFKGSPSLSENAYNSRVNKMAYAPAQAELLSAYREAMRSSPFKNNAFAAELLKSATEATAATKTHAAAHEETVAAPEDVEEYKEPLPLTHESLRASIRNFFNGKQELRLGRTSHGFTVAESTVKLRVDQLTEVAAQVLGNEVQTLPAFKGRLTSMEKPDSKLATKLTDYFLKNVANYSKGFYQGDAITGYSADAKGAEYAQALCQHLKHWITVDHVTVARSDPKAPGTKALAERLAAKEAPDKGKSAA